MEILYRKVAVTVKAVQFTSDNKDSVYNWAKSIQANVWHCYDEMGLPALKIPTLEGDILCKLGDYLIVEPFPTDWRKLYPCKPSIFNQTYELFDTEIPDNTQMQIQKLEADKAELLEALEEINSKLNIMHLTDDRLTAIYNTNRFLIQKHK